MFPHPVDTQVMATVQHLRHGASMRVCTWVVFVVEVRIFACTWVARARVHGWWRAASYTSTYATYGHLKSNVEDNM